MPYKAPEIIREPEKLRAAVDDYLAGIAATVSDRDLKTGGVQPWQTGVPSMVGLACYLGVCKETLYQYINGDIPYVDDMTKQDIVNCLRDARSRIEAATLQAAGSGRIDSRIASLILAGYGYGQRVEVDQTARVTIAGAGSDEIGQWSE